MHRLVVFLFVALITQDVHAHTINFPDTSERRMYTIRYGCTTRLSTNRYIHEKITIAFIDTRGPTTRSLQPEEPCPVMLFHVIGSTLKRHRDHIVSTYGALTLSDDAFRRGQKKRKVTGCVVNSTIDLSTTTKTICERSGGTLRSYYRVLMSDFSVHDQ